VLSEWTDSRCHTHNEHYWESGVEEEKMTKMTLMVIIDSFPLENLVKLVITALVSCANSFRSLTTQLETQRFEEKNNE
jgi:hypothetical protein